MTWLPGLICTEWQAIEIDEGFLAVGHEVPRRAPSCHVSCDGAQRYGVSPLQGVMIALRCIWAAVLAGSAVACHSDTAPDLSRLYASGMEQARTPPVILIPGFLVRDSSTSTSAVTYGQDRRCICWPVPNKTWYYPLTGHSATRR